MTSSVRINKIMVAIVDIAIYIIAFYLSFYIRYGLDLPEGNIAQFSFMLPWFVLAFALILSAYNLYSVYIKYDEILAALICVVIITDIVNIGLSFYFRQFAMPRLIFIISGMVQLLLLAGWRYLVWRRGLLIKYPRKAIIIGYPAEIRKLLASVNVSLEKGLTVVQEIRLNAKDNFGSAWTRYLGSQLAAEIEVILICASVGQEERIVILRYAIQESKMVMLVPGVYDIMLQGAKLVSAGDVPIMQLQGILAEDRREPIKRGIDILLSLAALVLITPLLPVIAVAIKLDSPGPAFYTQTRTGMKGRTFRVLKFRTMIQDAEKKSGPVWADSADMRVTRVGKFLRAARLDELPQFVNVLKGDMSLVGPRPERPFFIKEFSDRMPEFDYRHQIMSGLTGLAQVEGNYTTDPSNKLRYDLYYAQKRSLLMDIAILMRTARVILHRRKSS